MANVDIPGVGVVEFPDSMSTADINAASSKLYQQAAGAAAGASGQTTAAAAPQSPMDFLLKQLPGLAVGGALTGADVLGQSIARNAKPGALGRAIPATVELALKQLPFAHSISDTKNFINKVAGIAPGGPPPIAAASEATASVPTVSRSTRVEITPELRRRFPALKHFKSGETISAAQLDKIKLAKAGVPTRPINVQGKPAARAPAQTTEPSYTGGRGASGPELERRAAAMARAGGPPNLSLVPQEMPHIPPAQDLEGQLRQALAAEQAMGAQGLAPAERVGLRAGLRSALPPALEALTFLLGSQQVPQQMEEARRQYLQGAHPDLYRMLYENPNQHIPGGI